MQQLFIRAALAPFFLLPTVFIFFGLRAILGERPWVVRWLRRAKFYLYLWIGVVAAAIVLLLAWGALRSMLP